MLDPNNILGQFNALMDKADVWVKERHQCECGGTYLGKNRDRHIKSKKHLNYLNLNK